MQDEWGQTLPSHSISAGLDYLVLELLVLGLIIAGLAGALFAFSKGSISPETLSVPRSVDGLAMVLLGSRHDGGSPHPPGGAHRSSR